MTIGIAAFGPNAGLAVFRGLSVVEKISSGCIGGFVSYAAITAEGGLRRFATQRGGASTLFIDGDRVGADPPPEVASAPLAALMSSGPDRPEPLDQFVAADPGIGLVTGHRFANALGDSGLAFNADALERMKAGASAKAAVDAVIQRHPQADVGLIALDTRGNVFARNTERVLARPDLGSAEQCENEPSAVVSVLHNAIHPTAGAAALVAAAAMDVMLETRTPEFWIQASAGIPVVLGQANLIEVDEAMRIIRVHTRDASLLQGRSDGAALYIGSEVVQSGRALGRTVTEPYTILKDGRIQSLSGQAVLRVGCRRIGC